MILQYRKSFRKQYRKLHISQKEKVNDTLETFSKNPFNERLNNHALKGKMKGMRSISAGFDLRLIFVVEGEYITVTMLEIGTHSQLY